MIQYLGVVFLALLALNVWAALDVIQSGAGVWRKLLWVLLQALPGLGFALWIVFGPRRKAA